MSINAKLPLRVRFENYLNSIGKETISRVDQKGSRFFNKIEKALERLASNKKKESQSRELENKAVFTEIINLTIPPVEDMAEEEVEEEEVVAAKEGKVEKAKEEEVIAREEAKEPKVEKAKEEEEVVAAKEGKVEKAESLKSKYPKGKNALKVSLALAAIAAVAFSYYYFTSSPSENSATAASYMNQSYGFAYAQERVLEAVNTTVVEPLTYSFNSSKGRFSSVSEKASYTILEGCYKNVSGVISSVYPIIEPVVNATRNVTETIVKNSSEKISQLQAGYTRATAEAGKQFFKATIGLFGQMLAKSVGR
ncbi:MAG: hypothetical protein K940chlam5_00833 [Candidatus Anoxychlamydiales bacterium]|nr:hypothetical protein [Candidatus Anoxychlamydiales bacterium]